MKLMYDPIMRVLTVLEILQARDHVSGSELAERLEVNVRTVQRYIARLQDLCIPVESVRGVGGFYRLKPGFRLPPPMFTDEEAFAAMLGLRALRHLGLSAFASDGGRGCETRARSTRAFEKQRRNDRRSHRTGAGALGGFHFSGVTDPRGQRDPRTAQAHVCIQVARGGSFAAGDRALWRGSHERTLIHWWAAA